MTELTAESEILVVSDSKSNLKSCWFGYWWFCTLSSAWELGNKDLYASVVKRHDCTTQGKITCMAKHWACDSLQPQSNASLQFGVLLKLPCQCCSCFITLRVSPQPSLLLLLLLNLNPTAAFSQPVQGRLHCYSTLLLPLKGTNREWRDIFYSRRSPNFLFVQVLVCGEWSGQSQNTCSAL